MKATTTVKFAPGFFSADWLGNEDFRDAVAKVVRWVSKKDPITVYAIMEVDYKIVSEGYMTLGDAKEVCRKNALSAKYNSRVMVWMQSAFHRNLYGTVPVGDVRTVHSDGRAQYCAYVSLEYKGGGEVPQYEYARDGGISISPSFYY